MLTITEKLATLEDQTLLRKRRVVTARHDKMFTINNQPMINFAGNDYLGLAQDHRIQDALIQGAKEFGFGSGSSALISGYSSIHQELEEHFAAFLGRRRALFFNSGYHANLGVVTTFADRHTPIIADKHCHASIIDAITLTRAPHYRYRHHDLNHAEELLEKHTTQPALLISESVFSMTGAITDAHHLAATAKQHNATLMIDDAHGFGILGQHGHGVCEHFNLSTRDLPILITPFGKALGGMGAMVSGSHDMIELLLQKARTYCYSTAMPPAICAANLQALKIIQTESWRIAHLHALINFFNREATQRNISLLSSDITPIKCILSGSNQQTLALQEKLREKGMFVAAIRPPTVAHHTARLRISLSTAHTEADITQLLDLVADDHANTSR